MRTGTPFSRMVGMTMVTTAILGICILIPFRNVPILAALDARGIATQATITEVGEPYRRKWRSRGHRSQDFSYRYQSADGVWHQAEMTRIRRNSRTLHVGYEFELVYLPDRPQVHNSALQSRYADMGMVWLLLPLAALCGWRAWVERRVVIREWSR
ncbi:MAG: DUF3592 domain-containing protein [Pseudomonadota bacterium]